MNKKYFFRDHIEAFDHAIDKGVFTSNLESATDNQYAKNNLYINDWMYMHSSVDVKENGFPVYYDVFKNKLYRNSKAVIYKIGLEKEVSNVDT